MPTVMCVRVELSPHKVSMCEWCPTTMIFAFVCADAAPTPATDAELFRQINYVFVRDALRAPHVCATPSHKGCVCVCGCELAMLCVANLCE